MAVIIANNVADPVIVFMTGVAPSVTIPTVSISQADGTALKTALGSGMVWAMIGTQPTEYEGADINGYAKMRPEPVCRARRSALRRVGRPTRSWAGDTPD